ncbi:MAG: sugar ABC transporter permease [bacterium]|nr:sugar ABC transporter permease [bacterium]
MRKTWKSNLVDAYFVLPGLLIYIIFLVVPIVLCFLYSFTNWDGISKHFRVVGLMNFITLLSDISFLDALKVTLLITLFTTLLVNIVGILLAVLIESLTPRASEFCKAAVFFPATLSSVVVSFIWAYMTQTNGGIINTILTFFRLPGIDFYQTEFTITLMVSAVISWAAVGFYTTVYIANLKGIPLELYESARIDGANASDIFWHIMIPQLTPAITINTVLAVIWGLKQYDFVKVRVPFSIQTIPVNAVERAFDYNMLVYSSAIVVYLFFLIIGFSLLQIRFMKQREVSNS